MLDNIQINDLLKKAQEIQSYSKNLKDEMNNLEIKGESSNGMVNVVMDAKHILKKLSINSMAMNNKAGLEECIIEAVNNVTHKVEKDIVNKMVNLSSSMRDSLAEIKIPF